MAKHCFMYEFSAEKKGKKVFALTIIFVLPDGEFVQRKRWMRIMRGKKKGFFFLVFKTSHSEMRKLKVVPAPRAGRLGASERRRKQEGTEERWAGVKRIKQWM